MKRPPDPEQSGEGTASARLVRLLRYALAPIRGVPDVATRERIFAAALVRAGVGADIRTVSAEGGDWRVLRPGVALKVLQRDSHTGMASYLVRYDPGSRVDRHPQASLEECMLIRGDLRIDDVDMRPGDWQIARPGGEHGPLTSVGGALVYVRGVLRVVPDALAPD